MVTNGASSHKTIYIDIFSEIVNLEGHLNRCIGSKVTRNFAEWVDFAYWWSCIGKGLPYSLHRLVFIQSQKLEKTKKVIFEPLVHCFQFTLDIWCNQLYCLRYAKESPCQVV